MRAGNEIIAHNIQLLRGKESQEEFARRFGSNQKNIQAYEVGRNRPKASFLLALSEATGVPVHDLMNKKLRRNVEGKIVNLDEENFLRNARAELNILIKNFEDELLKFLKALQVFEERLNTVENKEKNKGTKKSNRRPAA